MVTQLQLSAHSSSSTWRRTFPLACFIWTIYSNICLWKGDEKTADVFGDFQSEFWRHFLWSSVIPTPCCTCHILFNKVRLCSTRRQSSLLLNNMAALKTKQKRQIWQNLAQAETTTEFLWCVDIHDSSLNITGQILYQKLFIIKNSFIKIICWGLWFPSTSSSSIVL